MDTTRDESIDAPKMNASEKTTMRIFRISPDDRVEIRLLSKRETLADGLEKFESEEELAALAANWPTARLVAVWNKLPKTVK